MLRRKNDVMLGINYFLGISSLSKKREILKVCNLKTPNKKIHSDPFYRPLSFALQFMRKMLFGLNFSEFGCSTLSVHK